jgi:hypothetical protein
MDTTETIEAAWRVACAAELAAYQAWAAAKWAGGAS